MLPQAWLAPWVMGTAIAAALALAVAATISRWRAHHHRARPAGDRLTGLPNCAALFESLASTLGAPCAVLALRVENFESLRHRLGRRAAERLIVRLGWRVAGAVRPEDVVGRIRRDEYAVLVTDLSAVGCVADRLRERLSAPVQADGVLILLPVAVGIAIARPGDSPDDLVARAQDAAGRNAQREPLEAVSFSSVAA